METGFEILRDVVSAFSYVNLSFVERFSTQELIVIRDAWRKAELDYFPDTWTERQVQEALLGFAPQWDDDDKPIYQVTGH